jgi:hypothetical protein
MLFLGKKHDFDLENPDIIKIDSKVSFKQYKCKNCDKTFSLNLWQMKSLPLSMKYGCGKKMKRIICYLIIFLNFCFLQSCGLLFSSNESSNCDCAACHYSRNITLDVVSTSLTGSVSINVKYSDGSQVYNSYTTAPLSLNFICRKNDYLIFDIKNNENNGDVTVTTLIEGKNWKTLTGYGAFCEVLIQGSIP